MKPSSLRSLKRNTIAYICFFKYDRVYLCTILGDIQHCLTQKISALVDEILPRGNWDLNLKKKTFEMSNWLLEQSILMH